MNVEKIVVNKKQARELYREYKSHKMYSEKMDREIQRAYQLIAQGRMVIRALESVRVAGLNDQQLPKLAIANALTKICHLQMWMNGSAQMAAKQWPSWRDNTTVFRFQVGTFPDRKEHLRDMEAIVPLIPIHLRPTSALGSYSILWEAEWRRQIPRDPMLLRRIGGDLWLVVAAWDLTEVERAAMATRVSA